jgi:serine/threonine protein kinase
MSPEQAWGREDLDGRSDLWSLGVVLYECLTGVSPFDGANDRAVLASIVATDPPHLRSTGVGVDEGLADAVMLALTRAPEARIPSASAWEAALANVGTLAAEPWHAALFPGRPAPGHPGPAHATGRTPAAPAALPPPAERSPWKLLLTALAAAAVLALAWMALRPGPSASGTPAQPVDSVQADARPTGPQRPTDTVATTAPISADSRQSSVARGSTGTDSAGTDSAGTDSAGTDSAGTDSAGTDSAATDSTGTDSTGTNPTATDSTGTNPTAPDSAGGRATGREAGGASTVRERDRQRSSARNDAHRPVDVRADEAVPGARSAGPNAAPLVDEL